MVRYSIALGEKMAERKCTQCGAVLNQSNPGKLCFPCQEKMGRELRDKNFDNPNYDVEDMCSILSLSPEQVRRLGRKNVIPGRIPMIKQHLYQKEVVDQWITSGGELPKTDSEITPINESDSVKETHNKSINFDKQLFLRLDKIMNERDLINFLSGLELHRHYQLSEFLKVGKFCELIRFEGNKYINAEIQQLQNDLFVTLEELIPLLKIEFKEEFNVKGEKDPLCRLLPSGSKYLDKKTIVERTKEIEHELVRLINEVKEKYNAYRGYIRDRLYI